VFQAHSRLYHSTLGLREIKKKEKILPPALRVASNHLFQILNVYWSSPTFGDLGYKSK